MGAREAVVGANKTEGKYVDSDDRASESQHTNRGFQEGSEVRAIQIQGGTKTVCCEYRQNIQRGFRDGD